LQDYAASLISDPNHSGPLKCPCCPRLLRVEDAKVALDKLPGVSETQVSMRKVAQKAVINRVSSKRQVKRGLFDEPECDANSINNSALEVLEKWDAKTRDEMLRSMKDFRPCPHCSEGGTVDAGDDSSPTSGNMANIASNKGGGFVTPECLAPINEERESNAESLIQMAGTPSSHAVLLAYAIYYLYCTGGSTESNGGQTSAALQIALAIIPSLLLPILPHAIRLVLATMARKEIMRPILVNCPCCLKEFNLEASSEFQLSDASSDNAAEAATKRWKSSNTRACPGCASPIMKDGGCNHVKCLRCRADFCWACMRSRTHCKAYQCKNGAPFGNAFGDGSVLAVRAGLNALEGERQAGSTLVERIDHVEALALRHLRLTRTFPMRYVAGAALTGIICMVVSCLATPRRVAVIVWIVIRRILSLVTTSLFSPLRLIFAVVLCSLISYCASQLRRNNRRADIDVTNRHIDGGLRRGQHQNGTRGFNWRANNIRRRRSLSFRRPGFRTEEEQLAEAISRSLAEQ